MANPTMPVSSEMMRKCLDAGGRAAFTSRCYAVNRPYDRELGSAHSVPPRFRPTRCL